MHEGPLGNLTVIIPALLMDHVPSPATLLVTFPPGLKLFETLPKQIFFPSMSAFVSGFANASDGKKSERLRVKASETRAFNLLSHETGAKNNLLQFIKG